MREILKDNAMSKFLPLLLTLLLINGYFGAAPAGSHSGARFYRGDISVPTEWEGVIRVTGQVTVKEGVTLTVAPGTKVLVNSGEDVSIIVEGKFYVRGLPDMKVVFEPADGCYENSIWGGIIFLEGSKGEIEDAVISCSKKGIWGELAGVTMVEVVTDNRK